MARILDLIKRNKKITASIMLTILIIWFVPFVPALKWQSVTVTRWLKAQGEVQVEVGPEIKGWTQINRISKHAINAIIASEDGRFYSHSGLDFAEIYNSAMRNIEEGKLARGGSTITQQVVKMAFLSREKSFIRKFREAIGSVLLECIMSKKDIMTWYINMAEFGDNVYGIEKASWHYFKTKPQLLTIEQSVHLALVLPSPNGWSVGLRKRNLTSFGHKRFKQILQNMRTSGFLTVSQYNQAMARGNFGSPIKGYSPPEDIIEQLPSLVDETDLDLSIEKPNDTVSAPISKETKIELEHYDELKKAEQSELDKVSPLNITDPTKNEEKSPNDQILNKEEIKPAENSNPDPEPSINEEEDNTDE